MKIAINIGKPKFKLTDKQIEYYAILSGLNLERKINDISLSDVPPSYFKENFLWYTIDYKLDGKTFDPDSLQRHDPILIQTIDHINDGTIKIIEIPDHTDYIIENCNGIEWISENHKIWGKHE
jgi:hypothetical protein